MDELEPQIQEASRRIAGPSGDPEWVAVAIRRVARRAYEIGAREARKAARGL